MKFGVLSGTSPYCKVIAVLIAVTSFCAAIQNSALANLDHAKKVCADKTLRIAVDVGHSKRRPGAISASGKKEYAFNARFAREWVERSRRHRASDIKFDLFIVNPNGANIGLRSRPARAFRRGAEIFISIHHDSVQKRHLVKVAKGAKKTRWHAPKIRGYSLFVSRRNPFFRDGKRIATLIGRSFRIARMKPTAHHNEDIPGERREFLSRELGLYEAPFTVIAAARIPAVLIEVGVIINRAEERELERPEYRGRVQLALLEALSAYCAGPIAR